MARERNAKARKKAKDRAKTAGAVHVNRQHKDRLFCRIFGNADQKDWALSLYNAVNGSSYTDPNEIEFNTIENFLYMGVRNDVSFIIGDELSVYEHQSTLNLNMPLM